MNIIPSVNYNDRELMEFIGLQESQSILTTTSYTNQVDKRLEFGWKLRGDRLPWVKTHDLVACDEGKVSIWGGINGHKKSMLLGMVMMWFSRVVPVGISSFEMPVIDTMERMISQAAGCEPARKFGKEWGEWGKDRLFFYDQLDTVPTERVLGSIYYMAKECGCKHIMIDSLTKCGLRSGDRDAEKTFLDTLSAAAKALKVHIHLVAHVRKPAQGGDEWIPGRFDIRGAGEITDLVDNVFIVWADKKKDLIGHKINSGFSISGSDQDYYDNRPDQRLIVAKQRFGRWEGQIALGFDTKSMQFTENSYRKIMRFDLSQELDYAV